MKKILQIIYVHDSIFSGFCYNYEENTISSETIRENKFIFIFHNVIAFKMTSCDFGGPAPYVLD